MSDLETKLRQLARNGELTYLSMIPVAGKGEYGATFVAQIAPASRFGRVEGRDADPVKALLMALDELPKAFVKEKVRRDTKSSPSPKPWDIIS